jgi:hypothetical protein
MGRSSPSIGGVGRLTELFESSRRAAHPEIVPDLSKLPEPIRRVIKSLKVKRTPTGDLMYEVSLYAKLAALELLMKYRAMLKPDSPSGVDAGRPKRLEIRWVFDRVGARGVNQR